MVAEVDSRDETEGCWPPAAAVMSDHRLEFVVADKKLVESLEMAPLRTENLDLGHRSQRVALKSKKTSSSPAWTAS